MVDFIKHVYEGSHSVTFDCETPVDEAVEATDHTPNGYFWEDVANLLIATHTPGIADAVVFDCEGSMFCANSDDPAVLDIVIGLMAPAVTDPDRITAIVTEALAAGYEFDD